MKSKGFTLAESILSLFIITVVVYGVVVVMRITRQQQALMDDRQTAFEWIQTVYSDIERSTSLEEIELWQSTTEDPNVLITRDNCELLEAPFPCTAFELRLSDEEEKTTINNLDITKVRVYFGDVIVTGSISEIKMTIDFEYSEDKYVKLEGTFYG